MNNSMSQQKTAECKIISLINKDHTENLILTVIPSILTPLVIGFNAALITGIIKIKQHRFTSSQILFIFLFVSDLTFGLTQLPLEIYFRQKSSKPSCTEVKMWNFSYIFLLCTSGTFLAVISMDRYLLIVYRKHYQRFATNKKLALLIISVLLISLSWAISHTLIPDGFDIKRLAKYIIAISIYEGTILASAIFFNIALLRKVKMETINSSIKCKRIDKTLTKTITIITAVLIISYLPGLITWSVLGYASLHSENNNLVQNTAHFLSWSRIPTHINAMLNSVIYLARNRRMKHYYKNLFGLGNAEKKMETAISTSRITDSK